MKINWYSGIFGTSGYAIHSKNLMGALYDQGVTEISYLGERPNDWPRHVNDAEYNIMSTDAHEDAVGVMISTPPMWRLALANGDKHFIGFLVWEGDKVPEYWVEYMLDERVDQIWVPSKYVKEAIENTLHDCYFHNADEVLDKVHIVPHGVDLSKFSSKDKPTDKLRFICNKGWRGGWEDRGGVPYVIKGFLEAFKDRDDVELIVKLNPAYLPPDFNFNNEMKKLGLEKSDKPVILVNTDNVKHEGLKDMYNDAHYYVCAAHSEGFNIPGIEAMACGLPNIQVTLGGQSEYLDIHNSLSVKYDLYTPKDVMYEEAQWALPNGESLINMFIKAADLFYHNSRSYDDMVLRSLKTAGDFTWAESAKKAKTCLKSLV